MHSTAKMIKVSDAMAWIEDETVIALQCATKDGKPATFDAEQARRLARGLEDLANALDSVQRHKTK